MYLRYNLYPHSAVLSPNAVRESSSVDALPITHVIHRIRTKHKTTPQYTPCNSNWLSLLQPPLIKAIHSLLT